MLAIADDGTYRILPPPEKLLFTGKLLHCEVFDPEKGAAFTVVYRDKQRFAFGKRVHIQSFIRAKEYQLIKDKAGKVDLLLPGDATGTLHLKFAAMKRQRVHEATFDLADLETTGIAARGTRLAPKPVAQVKLVPKAAAPRSAARPARASRRSSSDPGARRSVRGSRARRRTRSDASGSTRTTRASTAARVRDRREIVERARERSRSRTPWRGDVDASCTWAP